MIDGVAGGINVAANKLFGKSLDNSLAYAYADDAANGAKTVLRGTDLRGSVKATFENRKEFIQSRISKLEESSTVKGTGKFSKTDFDKEVDKAMGEAGRNQPEYKRKPIQPRYYEKMENNEGGTTTYTVVSKSNGKEYKVMYDKNGHPIFNAQFHTTLPESKYLSSDSEQFTFCNKDLLDKAMKDPELKSKFTGEELEGFKEGKMQLVDYFEHEAAKHTGGREYLGENGRNSKIKRDIANRIRELFS